MNIELNSPQELQYMNLLEIKQEHMTQTNTFDLSELLADDEREFLIYPIKGDWEGFFLCQFTWPTDFDKSDDFLTDICTSATTVILEQYLKNSENNDQSFSILLSPFVLKRDKSDRKLSRILELLNYTLFQYPIGNLKYGLKFDSIQMEIKIHLFGKRTTRNDFMDC